MANPPGTKEDVLSLLDSLGDTPVPVESTDTETVQIDAEHPTSSENEKELLGFLDDLVKQPSRSQTPRPAGGPRPNRDVAHNIAKKAVEKPVEQAPTDATLATGQQGGWLGGLWSIGSAAVKTAEQRVRELQQTEEAKAWEDRVRENVSVLGKLGTDLRSRTMPSLSSTLTSVLNTIAPPISKHEGRLPGFAMLMDSFESGHLS